MTNEWTNEDRIKKAVVELQTKNPFFTYLSLYLKFHKVEKGVIPMDTMGVSDDGNVYYCDEFVGKLDDDELLGLITHELFHLVFMTSIRKRNRNKDGWGFASDLAINTLLINNGFQLPKGGVIPENDCFDFGSDSKGNRKIIKEVSKKSAEETL